MKKKIDLETKTGSGTKQNTRIRIRNPGAECQNPWKNLHEIREISTPLYTVSLYLFFKTVLLFNYQNFN